jgi:quinolinate synthase
VLLPDLEAGCSLADGCPPDEFQRFIEAHPGHTVISYVNCSAAVKALSDIICTSANAEVIVRSVPEETPILFAPDQNLGRYLIGKTGRDMVLWPATCIVHEIFSEKRIVQLKVRHPQALVAAHPECTEPVLRLADHIGSTSSLLKFVTETAHDEFIIATEPGIIHQMEKRCPDKTFIPAPASGECACNECPYMRLNTLEKMYLCMRDLHPAIEVEEGMRQRALLPIERMLEITARAG